jgi:hypothetical protein
VESVLSGAPALLFVMAELVPAIPLREPKTFLVDRDHRVAALRADPVTTRDGRVDLG